MLWMEQGPAITARRLSVRSMIRRSSDRFREMFPWFRVSAASSDARLSGDLMGCSVWFFFRSVVWYGYLCLVVVKKSIRGSRPARMPGCLLKKENGSGHSFWPNPSESCFACTDANGLRQAVNRQEKPKNRKLFTDVVFMMEFNIQPFRRKVNRKSRRIRNFFDCGLSMLLAGIRLLLPGKTQITVDKIIRGDILYVK